MMIWMIYTAGSPPQHIGNANGAETTKDLLKGAQAARHTYAKFAVRATEGNDVMILMFDGFPKFAEYKRNNPNIAFSEPAIA